MQGLHNAGGMPAGPNGPTELGLPARCCDTGGFWAAAAERVSATTKVAAKSVVFTRFLLFDFFAILCRLLLRCLNAVTINSLFVSDHAERHATALYLVETRYARIAPVGPSESEGRRVQEHFVSGLPGASKVVGQRRGVRYELPENAATSVQRIQALRRYVEPVLSGCHGDRRRPGHCNGVLVQADEIAAGRCHHCGTGAGSDAGPAVAFRNARAHVIGSQQRIEGSVGLHVKHDAPYVRRHSGGNVDRAIGAGVRDEQSILIRHAGSIDGERVEIAAIEQARVAQGWRVRGVTVKALYFCLRWVTGAMKRRGGLIGISCHRCEAERYHERECEKRCFHYIPPLGFSFAETRNRFCQAQNGSPKS